MSLLMLRKDSMCLVFGVGRDLLSNVLPTYEDVMLCYLWTWADQKEKKKRSETKILLVTRA